MWAAIPLVEAGAVALIGAAAGVTITKKVLKRIDQKRAKSPRPSQKPNRPRPSDDSGIDTDSDDHYEGVYPDGSSSSQARHEDKTRNPFSRPSRRQMDDAHIVEILQSLPSRKFLVPNLVSESDHGHSQGSKWRSGSPYGNAGDEPEWIQQRYRSHEEWYDDLDGSSKVAYLGYLYNLLKQARKKSTEDLERSASKRRRGHSSNLYALVERQALDERSEKKERQRRPRRPSTPTEEDIPLDPRTTSWVNTHFPLPVPRNREFEAGYYPTATEFRDNTRGPRFQNQGFGVDYYPAPTEFRDNTRGPRLDGHPGRQNIDLGVGGSYEPAISENGSAAQEFNEERQLSTRRPRQPRSRSSTPSRGR